MVFFHNFALDEDANYIPVKKPPLLLSTVMEFTFQVRSKLLTFSLRKLYTSSFILNFLECTLAFMFIRARRPEEAKQLFSTCFARLYLIACIRQQSINPSLVFPIRKRLHAANGEDCKRIQGACNMQCHKTPTIFCFGTDLLRYNFPTISGPGFMGRKPPILLPVLGKHCGQLLIENTLHSWRNINLIINLINYTFWSHFKI